MKKHFNVMTHTAPETIRGHGYRKACFFEQANLPQMALHYRTKTPGGQQHPVSDKASCCATASEVSRPRRALPARASSQLG